MNTVKRQRWRIREYWFKNLVIVVRMCISMRRQSEIRHKLHSNEEKTNEQREN